MVKKKAAPKKRTAPKKKTVPKKKTAAKKKTASKKRNISKQSGQGVAANLIKTACGIFILLLLVIGAGIAAKKYLPLPRLQDTPSEKVIHKTHAAGKAAPLTFEVFPHHDRIRVPARGNAPFPPGHLPRVAIIIDDFGYDSVIAKKFCNIGVEITFSILPFSPQGNKIARMAHEKNREIMLHLPLEPMEYPRVNPGPGVLLASMSPDVLLEQLKKDMNSVPYAKGANNHMGSRITTISTKMYQIFSILKKREMFFVDSRTSRETLCRPSARLLKIPFGERDVFLDHTPDADAIRTQLRRLIRIARKQGSAIGIGHPHRSTYRVLREELPELRKKVRFVKASSLVVIIGD